MSQDASGTSARRKQLSAKHTQSNRRKRQREIQLTFCNSTFLSNGRLYTGLMTDVSQGGAGFRLESFDDRLDLQVDAELRIMVTHLKGETGVHGRVAWVRKNDDQITFGIEFLEQPENLNDFTTLDLDRVKIDPAWALRIPSNLAVRRQMLPFVCIDEHVYIACTDPGDSAALQAIERQVGHLVRPMRATPESLKKAISKIYGDAHSVTSTSVRHASSETNEEGDPVSLCDEILHAAFLRGASDVHIDPGREKMRIRFRVDGVLEEFRTLPSDTHAELISRFKVLSGLDIAERRSPQDGRFTHEFGPGRPSVDIRTATLLTKYGERMTLRLLAMQTDSLTLEKVGMSEKDRERFESAIAKPHGIILVTGPTGSGKTTTLYGALRRVIEREGLNLITIEDPIEYDIPGVAQVEVDAVDKVSFAKALRSVLRHDPDVVMIGEIRDQETADTAIKASLTGHLVLSTLHTNSAPSAVTRLVDMGVERYRIAATLRLAMAQRLVRRLCPHCRKLRQLTEKESFALNRPELAGRNVYEPRGCIYCTGKGYIGRLGIYEMLPVSEEVSTMIANGAEEGDLVDYMRKQGINLLLGDAIDKLLAGETSLKEVLAAAAV